MINIPKPNKKIIEEYSPLFKYRVEVVLKVNDLNTMLEVVKKCKKAKRSSPLMKAKEIRYEKSKRMEEDNEYLGNINIVDCRFVLKMYNNDIIYYVQLNLAMQNKTNFFYQLIYIYHIKSVNYSYVYITFHHYKIILDKKGKNDEEEYPLLYLHINYVP